MEHTPGSGEATRLVVPMAGVATDLAGILVLVQQLAIQVDKDDNTTTTATLTVGGRKAGSVGSSAQGRGTVLYCTVLYCPPGYLLHLSVTYCV